MGTGVFVGRTEQLALLERELARVRSTGTGRFLLIRGRRRVGKSRLVTEFLGRSGAATVYFTATRQPPARELALFVDAIGRSDVPAAALVRSGARFETWEAALRTVAAGATATRPIVVGLDELPYLVEDDRSLEAQLQAIWDRVLEGAPVLLVVIGSDLAMMQALTTYERPLYGRPSRELVVEPLRPAEVARLLGLSGADGVDAALVVGGFPLVALSWPRGASLDEFLRNAVPDPGSPLVSSAERTLLAEFPDPAARAVLAAVGSGEVAVRGIGERTGLPETSLRRTLDLLVAKRVLTVAQPLSARPGKRLGRHVVADPYLRFWLRFLSGGVADIERGRGDLVLERLRRGWAPYRGRAVEALVRAAVERQLPADRFAGARVVGGWWDRTGSAEVDLVGASNRKPPLDVAFVGSVKWREREPFGREDVQALLAARELVPGATARTLLVAVSRTEVSGTGADVVIGPDEVLENA